MNKQKIRKYRFLVIPVMVGILMTYCYASKPLCYDQFISSGLVKKQGGIFSFLCGYCVMWGRDVNSRIASTFISGIIENSLIIYKIVSVVLIFMIVVLATKSLEITEKNKRMSVTLYSVFILIVSTAVQIEVYFYANVLYLGMVLATEILLILAKKVMYDNNGVICKKTGFMYLLIVLIFSFWLETFSAALFIVSMCLVIWDIFFTKKINIWNIMASVISFSGLLAMGYHRKASVNAGMDVNAIGTKIELVITDLFKNNAGVTALMALVLILSVLFSGRETFKYKISKYSILAFWCYIMITSFCYYYNVVLETIREPYRMSVDFVPPVLKDVTIPLLLPIDNKCMASIIYILFAITILFRVVKSKNILSNLYIYGVGIVSVGVLFFTGEFYGLRIITPGILLFALVCVGISDDIDSVRCEKALSMVLIIVFLLLADRYYTKFSYIRGIKEYNENAIRQTVEAQMRGDWDYDKDVLCVKTYTGLLYNADPMEGEGHYIFYCEFYNLNEKTHIQCN